MKLLMGDCLELMKTLPDQSIDMVLADPPYGTTQNKWDSVIDLPMLWNELCRIAKPRAAVALFAQAPFDKHLAVSRIGDFRYEWIWHKTTPTGHLNAKRAPLKAHENVLIFAQESPAYYPQFAAGEAYTQKSGRASGNYGAQVSVETVNEGRRYPTTVQRFKRDKERFHPTQKPVALLEYLIKTYTKHGETVLDFCMGSGSTGVACVNTGRDFIGIERDEKYFEIATGRIESASVEAVA